MRTPKLVSAEPTNTGVESPARNDAHVDVGADRVEQAELVDAPSPRPRPPRPPPRRPATTSSGASDAPRVGAGEADELAGAAVDDAAEVAGDADRPRHRRRPQPDLRLDLVEQLERLAAGAVVLVEEREHRQVGGPGRPRTA